MATQVVEAFATKSSFDNALVDPYTYADVDLYHALFTRLRREAPVYWTESEGFRPFWTISKAADIRSVELRPAEFLNAPRLILSPEADELKVLEMTGGNMLVRSLVSMDDPDHRVFRSMTQAWFGAKNIRLLEDQIRALARESIDRMVDLDGRCDFAAEVALWYPLRVIMHILGVPPEDGPFLLKITQEVFGPADPDTQRAPGPLAMIDTVMEFAAYCSNLAADRRAAPRDDVASVIANATMPDGSPISDLDTMSYYMIIATAGHDTTSSSSAAGLLELIRNPDQMALLRSRPELLPTAIDEFIRWSTPVKHFFRTAAKDAEVGGKRIREGEAVMLCYPSANRDEELFDDPFSFRIDRPQGKHIAFGIGPHLCLGQHLAKLEIRILYEELLARFSNFELDGDPRYVASSFVSGLKSLPIRYS